MKRTHMNQQQTQNRIEDIYRSERENCIKRLKRQERIEEALELMRGIVRAPLGEFPERDERIKAAWHSSAE